MKRRQFLKFGGLAVATLVMPALIPASHLGHIPRLFASLQPVVPTLYGDGVHDDSPWMEYQIAQGNDIYISNGLHRLSRPIVLQQGDRTNLEITHSTFLTESGFLHVSHKGIVHNGNNYIQRIVSMDDITLQHVTS